MKAIPVLLCCIFLVAGCGPKTISKVEKVEGAAIMAPSDVLELVDNNTLFIHSFEEDSYLLFDHSGKLFGKDILNNKDVGNWDVSEDGELCMRMKKWWYGDLRCFQVVGSAKSLYLATANGVLLYTAEQYPGDAKRLFHTTTTRKKSYRRSIRSTGQSAEPTVRDADTAQNLPAEETRQESTPPVVDEQSAYSTPARTDLRSTVKWMARDCPGCNLAETDLKNADLVGANLVGANLRRASLKMANLRRANLEGAKLIAADLSYANLPGANLKNADLSGANLKGANLIRADLTGANLDEADLTDALLEGVKGLQ